MEMPHEFLTPILTGLVGRGLSVAKHGPAGGYTFPAAY